MGLLLLFSTKDIIIPAAYGAQSNWCTTHFNQQSTTLKIVGSHHPIVFYKLAAQAGAVVVCCPVAGQQE